MAGVNPDVNLLVSSEPELASGLALAASLADLQGWSVAITIVSDSPTVLMSQVEARVAEFPEAYRSNFTIEQQPADVETLKTHLESQTNLRLLLFGGLDQLTEARKDLLKSVRPAVLCFESHSGFSRPPREVLWLGGDEPPKILRNAAKRLVSKLTVGLELQRVDDSSRSDAETLWLLLATEAVAVDVALKKARASMDVAVGPVLLLRVASGRWSWFFDRRIPTLVSKWIPQMQREDRRALAEELKRHSNLNFEFVALICCSTFLASFGLVQNSAAVIIGAMLVAPLMTPILGAGLSLAHGNRPLFVGSLRTISLGFVAALATSCFFGLIVRAISPGILEHDEAGRLVLTGEMWSRTHPTSIDFLVGLVGGSAAAFARTRTHLADALAGAAIAAALVPPIATAGLHLSMLPQPIAPPDHANLAGTLIYGPILLFVANMLTIMIGSSFVLWACGVRAEHGHTSRERWATRTTAILLTLTVVVLVWIVQN